ncbi:MAG: fumarylacetoacetate hydrolase family protein [Saprospiraceae bacterium]
MPGSWHLYHTPDHLFVRRNQAWWQAPGELTWTTLTNRNGLFQWLTDHYSEWEHLSSPPDLSRWLPPVETQEVWAAGVTYYRSRDARMEESQQSGGATFYDKVYVADRPELFFKALGHRVSGHHDAVHIRKDSEWNVPEPELALWITSEGSIEGFAIGNDMSSRDIEGENPLYLPQAKVYDRSLALGPCLYVPEQPLPGDTRIQMIIERRRQVVFSGETTLDQLKRKLDELVSYLFHSMDFPDGVWLLTGTGIVPPPQFTLNPGDEVSIEIEPIGMLMNTVHYFTRD